MWPITKCWGSNYITGTTEPNVVKFCTQVGWLFWNFAVCRDATRRVRLPATAEFLVIWAVQSNTFYAGLMMSKRNIRWMYNFLKLPVINAQWALQNVSCYVYMSLFCIRWIFMHLICAQNLLTAARFNHVTCGTLAHLPNKYWVFSGQILMAVSKLFNCNFICDQ